MPGARLMPADVLARLLDLAKEGATIVFLDRYPEDVPGYAKLEQRRAEFKHTLGKIKELGNENGNGKTVLFGMDYVRTLAQTTAMPEAMKTSFDLSCVRRKNSDGYHYFISALTNRDTEG